MTRTWSFASRKVLQRTLAYLIAAAVCYIPANLLPVMKTTTAGGSQSDTIMQGVVLLWSPTGWPLSLIVLFASIMIPSAKILALGYLLITVKRGSITNNAQRVRLYRTVEIIGRWSMVDVFVDTFTVSLIQLQPLMSVEPGPGLLFFAAVVVLTMLAVESFDPRLIWDTGGRERKSKKGAICLTKIHHSREFPNPGPFPKSAPGSRSCGSSPSWRRRPASGLP